MLTVRCLCLGGMASQNCMTGKKLCFQMTFDNLFSQVNFLLFLSIHNCFNYVLFEF